jgi:hypothetical protein
MIHHKNIRHIGNNARSTSSMEGYNIFDPGFSCGLGLTYPVKEKYRISVELRNSLGLRNIYGYGYHEAIIKTGGINLLVGFSFLIKDKNNDKAQ